MRAAEYWVFRGDAKNPPHKIVDIVLIENGQRDYVARGIRVSGKREARAAAKRHEATPWNF